MTTESDTRSYGLLDVVVSSPTYRQVLSLLKQALLASLLVGAMWLSVIPGAPAIAGTTPVKVDSHAANFAFDRDDRTMALIACLPEQLGQPSLKRALNEMRNNQLERAFNLKANPKLSQAEIELEGCMNSKGFAS